MNTPANPNPDRPTLVISIDEVLSHAYRLVEKLPRRETSRSVMIYGIPRGGVPAALALWGATHGRPRIIVLDLKDIDLADCFVDDVWDTGKTEAEYKARYPRVPFLTLFDKRDPEFAGKWLIFPWEKGRDDD